MIIKPEPQRRRWYALLCENVRAMEKVEKDVKKLGVPVFSPHAFHEQQQGKWMVSVDDGHLFPRFLFIAMRAPGPWKSQASILWGAVYDVRGVIKAMGNYDREGSYRPMPIRYKEMRKIRTKHNAGERRLADERFKQGQKVKITGGNWSGFDGVFEMPVKDRVQVLLNLFGRATPVEIEENDVRAA